MNKSTDWALYRTFLAVVDTGSLSGAARSIGLAQPSIARHIDTLEALLDARLFVRTQRGLQPTELALSLVPQARVMATAAAALRRTATGAHDIVAGAVRITASDVVGVEHLPPILCELRIKHPALVIELSLSDLVSDLLSREADVAIRMTQPTQVALLARQLAPVELGLHAHRNYLDRAGTPTGIEQLSQHGLIGYDTQTQALRMLTAKFPSLDDTAYSLKADSNLAQLAAIRAGCGIGVCQAAIALRDPAIVRVLPDIAFHLPLWVVMHEDLKTNKRYRVVFDALVDGLSNSSREGGNAPG